jgi:NAD(P)H dehydrogenase (quinone)
LLNKKMRKINAAIIYYSSTGANHKIANWAVESARDAGAETKLLKVQELAPQSAIDTNKAWQTHADRTKDVPIASLDDLAWADVIVFSIPTRYGNVPAQMKQFLDSTGPLWAKGQLANKIVTAMSTAMNPHGGQEATILSLYTTMFHWGAIVVTPGYTDQVVYAAGGNPYGTSASVDDEGNIKEDIESAVKFQVKRALSVAGWIKKGSTNNESENEKQLTGELTEAQ